VLKPPFRSSFQRRADQALNDGIADFDALSSHDEAFEDSVLNLFGRAPVRPAPTPPSGAPNSEAAVPSGNNGVSPTSLIANTGTAITVAEGATYEINGVSGQSVTFTGTTGTLKLDDSLAFTGHISGLAGSDEIDLTDVSFGVQTQVTYLGNTNGGTLTITDGVHTANVALQGDYLASSWTLSSDGNGGTIVVDPVASNNWQTLKVGAGGYVTGIDIAPDGTMVVRCDTYGAYIWNGTQWQELVTSASLPATLLSPYGSIGVYEIQVASSNSNILYMTYDGYVLKSTNKGTTWTFTSYSQDTSANSNGANSSLGQKMAIDPNNPNVVYVGTPSTGLSVTTDGGTTWQKISAIPVGLAGPNNGVAAGITGILFDPAVGGVSGGKTNTIFACSYGNGVYESTNGGASWTKLSGGPTDVTYAAVSSTGVYYAVGDNQSDLWAFKNGAWTEVLNNPQWGIQTVAVDPFNPNHIITVAASGYFNQSFDAGATWSGIFADQISATDIPWLAPANQWLTTGGTAFDPLVPGKLWTTGGTGVWNATTPAQGVNPSAYPYSDITWNDQSVGIEQLVANQILVPPGGKPVLASWDRPFFYISDPNQYPTTYGPIDNSTMSAGWSVDYASSTPSFLVGIADFWGAEQSGYSTDGGQTWTQFATEPASTAHTIGGSIAASTPNEVVWVPANGVQPYYTKDGGKTWNPVSLPGVSSFSSPGYYLDARLVTADRVLPDTFYMYESGIGVFRSTDGGATWTKTSSANLGLDPIPQIASVPGEAGNLFFTGTTNWGQPFYRSTDEGTTWTAVSNVQNVTCFGFGAAAPGQNYPAIYIVGNVNGVYGVWQSINNAQSWTQIGTYPDGQVSQILTISGDPNIYGQVYVGFQGDGYAYLPANPVGPAFTGVTESPSTGDLNAGKTVTLTLNVSSAVTVAGGTPTLTLNDGGVATYTGGSGTNALTFRYTVGASDTNVASLAATAVNLNGATIKDGSGNAASLSLSGVTQSGPQIDTTTPTVASLVASGTGITAGAGDLGTGKVVTLTLNLSEAVTVAGGTPTLTLNDGGTATYTGGTGTNALTFSYTVGAGQNTADLAVTAVNLGTATVKDGAGNTANLTGAVTNPVGTLQIDTTAPSVTQVIASPGSGVELPGDMVTLTLTMNEAVTVTGTPTLTLNDGGTATYTGGSGSNTLTFRYTVGATDSTVSALAITQANLPNGATIKDGAGNAANLSGALTSFPSLAIDPPTPGPIPTSIVESPSTGDLNAGNMVTLTLNLSGAVTVAGGAPTLTLNDGGTATYTGGSGTNALTFSYTVGAGQNTASLAATAINLNGATVKDGSGNAAGLSLSGLTQIGPQIDTTTPSVSSLVASGTGITAGAGDLGAGKVVTLTLSLSEAVTVTGGTPTLTLNDGGTATYTGGTGTSALTFSYTVGAGQNTADLAVTAVNLGTATVKDGAGNAANLTGAVTNPAGTLQIDSTTPSVASLVASGTGITAGAGDLGTGSVVTLTLNLSEAVTVAGGTPTLTLNDGGTATYTGGTGTTALTFSYTVGAGQNTADLAVTAVNLGTATVKDGAGNAANLTGAVTNPAGTLQIDTTTPVISSIAESPTSGDLTVGNTVAYTFTMSEVVTVNTTGGSPTLTLNSGGTATYTGGSGTNALTFSYTVGAGQNTPDLMVSAVSLNGAMLSDGAGNAANLSLTGLPQGSPQVDTTAPTLASITVASSNGQRLKAGKSATFTLNMSEAVTVVGGTPTLALSSGGTATYTGGSGTSKLTFSYKVAAGQNAASLTATTVSLNGATIADGAGNVASLTLSGLVQSAQFAIDTTPPSVSSVVTSGIGIAAGTGDLTIGNVVTLTLNLSEAVTVTGGTPTLTLNDGGTATYTGGAGTGALTFSYIVAAGENTADLAVTAVNLGTATVSDSAGNAADLTGAVTNPAGTLQIDTTTASSIHLTQVGNSYFLYNTGNSGPSLKYSGALVVAGAYGAWAPIGAEQTASGYEVAWKVTGADQYTVWNTDSSGNYISSITNGVVSGSSAALESLETSFHQDLNRDGQIGIPTTVIEALGSTSLIEVGNNFYLNNNSSGTGPELKYAGAAVVAGAYGAWTPIGAEQTASGYEVAWKVTGADQYTVWNFNSSGNFISSSTNGVVSGSTAALESLETSFHQDLNGDGTIGPVATVIEAVGSTTLAEVANNFYLNSISSGSGPELKYAGVAVAAGAYGAWAPIGAEQTASGYEVAWKVTGADQYTVWNTDSSGNYISSSTNGVVSGSSAALESLETSFHQDLNGDGVVVTSGSGSAVSAGNLVIGAGASVEITGAYPGTITFAGSSGTLTIDNSASFSGKIAGQLAIGDVIDLADITAGASATIGYSGNNSPGTLTLSDGTNTASIALLGNYSLANFTASNDGHGGTSVVDPPLPSENQAMDPVESALNQQLALWSQHMASAFPSSAFSNGGPSLASPSELGDGQLSQLARPVANQLPA
jgi:20S proteasome alpha/beta subunit